MGNRGDQDHCPGDAGNSRKSITQKQEEGIQQVRSMLRSPEMIVKTWQVGNEEDSEIKERDVAEALRRLDPVWEELFPIEQQRLVELLIARVDVAKGDIKVHLRAAGLDTLARELNDLCKNKENAA